MILRRMLWASIGLVLLFVAMASSEHKRHAIPMPAMKLEPWPPGPGWYNIIVDERPPPQCDYSVRWNARGIEERCT